MVEKIKFSKDEMKQNKIVQKLKTSELKYRVLVENLPQKIFLKDSNSVYISCNNNFAKDLKIRAEDIAGKTDYDFFLCLLYVTRLSATRAAPPVHDLNLDPPVIVFREFGRIENDIKKKVSGSGLGLALTKRLIELHGGEIWFESEIGKGTTFFFTIPK